MKPLPAYPVIDAHHHLWRYTPEEFGWIDDSMSALRRDFLPSALHAALIESHVDFTIAVQARQTIEETSFLLDLAQEHNFIAGVVGWMPLASRTFSRHLEELTVYPKLVGLRHVVQAEPAGFLDQADFNRGITELQHFDLAYDLLLFHPQLPEAIRFVDRHPAQRFILDHIAKPAIRAGELEPWRTHLIELGRRSNVTCKLSGMVTETYPHWTLAQLRPYLDVALEAFTPARLMAGSDWPVCLTHTTYSLWWQTLRDSVAQLSPTEQQQIFSGAATAAYHLPLSTPGS